jgi:hypothetical protein
MTGLVAGLPAHILNLTGPLRALTLVVGFQRLWRDLKRQVDAEKAIQILAELHLMMVGDEFGNQTIQPLLTDDLLAVLEANLPLPGRGGLAGELRDGFGHLPLAVGTLAFFGGASLNLTEDLACLLAAAVARDRRGRVLREP